MKKIFGFTFNVCLSMVVFALLLTSCVHKKQDLGTVITKEIKVMPFKDIEVHGNASVHIVPGNTYKVIVKGRQKLITSMEVELIGSNLVVNDTQNGIFPKKRTTFRNNYFEGYTNRCLYYDPTLHNVYLENNASLNIDKAMTADSVSFGMLGNSSVDVAGLTAKGLEIKAQGNVSMNICPLNRRPHANRNTR